MFNLTGQDCGNCVSGNVNMDTTSVSCSDLMSNGPTCDFSVMTVSQDCRLTSNPVNVMLRGELTGLLKCDASSICCASSPPVPSTPTNLAVNPVYHRNGSFKRVSVEFTGVVSNVSC